MKPFEALESNLYLIRGVTKGDKFSSRIKGDAVHAKEKVFLQDQFLDEFIQYLGQNYVSIDEKVGKFSGPDKAVLSALFENREKRAIKTSDSIQVKINSPYMNLTDYSYTSKKRHFWQKRGTVDSEIDFLWDEDSQRALVLFCNSKVDMNRYSGLVFVFFPREVSSPEVLTYPGTYTKLLHDTNGVNFRLDEKGAIHGETMGIDSGKKEYHHYFPFPEPFRHEGKDYYVYGNRLNTAPVNFIHFSRPQGGTGSVRLQEIRR